MSPEPGLNRAWPALPLRYQLLEHRHHSDWAYARAHDVVEAFHVGLCFVLAAEPRKHSPTRDVYRSAGNLAVTDARQDAGACYADVCPLRLLHLFDCVAS